jgi:phosphoenolpyruvate carboxylase
MLDSNRTGQTANGASIAFPGDEPGHEKDRPLWEDIRLLGRLLGETVRAQEGEAAYALIERIRQTGIRFHHHDDTEARRELDQILNGLSGDDTIRVVRAFSFFSHLANLAEDQHHIRRTRAHLEAGSPPRPGTLDFALARARELPDEQLRGFFDGALVVPVLTAHPTEVQRASTRRTQAEITRLLDRRDRVRLTPEEQTENAEELRRAVLRLWQSRILRYSRLTVEDEVSNGLSYFEQTFLSELPRLCVGGRPARSPRRGMERL